MEAIGVDCKWVNSDRQLADSLTKPMAAHAMLQLCTAGTWKIAFDENFTAAKKIKRATRDEYFKARNEDDRKHLLKKGSKAKPKESKNSVARIIDHFDISG